MQSQSEEECAQLMRLLPPTEATLLDWAINLMANVAQMENLNNMNARNIAMVFAPNMTQEQENSTVVRKRVFKSINLKMSENENTQNLDIGGLFGELVLTARSFVCFYYKDLVCGTGAHFAVCLGCSLTLIGSHFD
ncbi:hypothetical protein JHK85_028169 [Glycine max]|nr:hypothetical protein JHK85_028169 [Glycine max]